ARHQTKQKAIRKDGLFALRQADAWWRCAYRAYLQFLQIIFLLFFLKLSHLAHAGSTFCLFLVIVSYLDVYTFKRML
ncbi:hypothetical protein, partial [Pseudescherichia vulneris]|uniref:hypothetical protein n=1 Tax=Pseudescherichia vulneris TaxID=566 RepID=UPI0028D6195D